MDNTIKPLSRLLLLVILVCGLSFQASYVSGVFTPSVPEFTVELVAYPYDVASVTTTSIDQYTGKEIVKTTHGYRVENRSIEITIRNQPFTPYVADDGKDIDLYYGVRVKGHFGEDWEELYSRYKSSDNPHQLQSSCEYTVLSLPADYPNGAKVDFQVKAMFGYYYDELAGRPCLPLYNLASVDSSCWSTTQTLTIDWNNVIVFGEPEATDDTETPNTTTTQDDTTIPEEPTPDNSLTSESPSDSNQQGALDLTWVPKDESSEVEEFVALFGIAAIIAALVVGLFFYFKLRKS